MLWSCSGCLRQGAGRAHPGLAGPSSVLCRAFCVQRRADGPVPAQPAAAALPAGHRVQQRGKRDCNGPAGQLAVRRGDRAALAAGRCLHPAGTGAGHGGGAGAGAGAGPASGHAAAGEGGAAPASRGAGAGGAAAGPGRFWVGRHRGQGQQGGLIRGRHAAPLAAAAAPRGAAPPLLPAAHPCRSLAPLPAAAAASPAVPRAPAAAWRRAPAPPASLPAASCTVLEPSTGSGGVAGEGQGPQLAEAHPASGMAACTAEDDRRGSSAGSAGSCAGGGCAPGGGTGGGSAGAKHSGGTVGHTAANAGEGPSASTDGSGVTEAAGVAAAASAACSTSLSPSNPGASHMPPQQQQQQQRLADSPIVYRRSDKGGGIERLGRLSYRLVLAYDGTDYCGWQLQPSAPTVQGRLEGALCTLLRTERDVLGVRAAGRTDSGVHARGQVVQFCVNRELDAAKLPYKLNSVLPPDIRVMAMSRTAPDFSATCSALGKCYHYQITTGEAHDPMRHRYAMHVHKPLDLAAMRAAAAELVGTHDFTQLSNISEEGGRLRRRNPVKTLRRVDVVELGELAPGGIRIEVEGNGFLYKMVRHMAGVLVAVGEGRLPVEAVVRMLELGGNAPPGCNGTYRGYNVAPARGLCLHQVFYDPRVDDPSAILYPELLHDEYGRLLESIPSSDEE